MAFAAVPQYLGQDFRGASPGLRFGMYYQGWSDAGGTRQEDGAKRDAIDKACALEVADRRAMNAWNERQRQLAAPLASAGLLAEFHARAVAPFATGLGSEHPTENGFAFLWPYGLPYLPGSGIKGVLRAAARELGWPAAEHLSLFGSDVPDGEGAESQRGVLSFWDAMPVIEGERLRVEIMTPHQTHYLQPQAGGSRRDDKSTAGSDSPHDSGNPNPIYFLSVPPRSQFVFRVSCDLDRLGRLAPELQQDHRWRLRLQEGFEHAFEWLGFGAKTAVGYGAMKPDEQAQAKAAATSEADRAARAKAAMAPGQRALVEFEEEMTRMARKQGNRKTGAGQPAYQAMHDFARLATKESWAAEDRQAAADAIEKWGGKLTNLDAKDLRKKLRLAELRQG
jgi:CRISPR-associated protein Cmr6